MFISVFTYPLFGLVLFLFYFWLFRNDKFPEMAHGSFVVSVQCNMKDVQ
jgi:hypothetical protein